MGELERDEAVEGQASWRPPEPFGMAAQGHAFEFFPAGADRREALLGLIAGACESLDLCFYIFATDEAAVMVRDALSDAAGRGVTVRLIIDSFGATADAAFFAPLTAAGGTLWCFSPRWSQRYLIRNHQKFVIADRRRAILGGFNVENGYFATVPDEPGWVDLGVIVEGPVVDSLGRWFAGLVAWTADPRASWRKIRRMVRRWEPGKGPVQLLIGGPTRGLSSWARSVRADIQRAERVDLIMAYFSPSAGMVRRIGQLARRGTARLVLAGHSDNPATVGATRSLYDYFLKRRAEVWEFVACKLHTKLLVVDDLVYFGSANLDMRSGFLNLELMLRIEDAALAESMREFVAAHLPACDRITPALHKRRATLFNRVRWNLSWFLVSVVDYTVSRRLNLGL
jgi:cardiolipin synthase